MLRRLAPAAAAVFIAAAAILMLSSARQAIDSGAGPAGGEGSGRLVTLPDHRRMNFRCAGAGKPTVLLESGFGAGAEAWTRALPRIAGVTRVCAYDRAGYGFSDPGPLPRDGAAIARDLDQGLKAAGIAGPYVVVGHSAGGLYSRLFAARRPGEVVGLVFVDSSVEHQTERLVASFGPGAGSLDGVQRRTLHCLKATSDPATASGKAQLPSDCPATGPDAHAQAVARRPDTWRTQLSELDSLFTTTSDEVDRTGDLLQDIPAIVLTAGKADGGAAGADDPGAQAWQALHRQLAGRFLNHDQRIVKSSHLMMIDRPEVVADAALELVKAARKR